MAIITKRILPSIIRQGTYTNSIISSRTIGTLSARYLTSPQGSIYNRTPRRALSSSTTRQNASPMETIRNTVAENFGKVGNIGTHPFSIDDVPDLSGKVAVVTGGSQGIGFGCTHTLLKKNIAKLYILSTSAEVVEGAKAAIAKDLGQDAADKTHWMQCDLANWNQVKETAEAIKKDTDRLDILVNNAARGIMTYQLTDLGVDQHMAVNHIGHTVLTSYLLPLLKKTASDKNTTVRISNQASNVHTSTPKDTKFATLDELNTDLGPNTQYGRSKLAAILYSRYLARKVTQGGYPNVLINATHPGFVSTKASKYDIHEAYPLGGYAMSTLMEPFKKDQFEGALPTLFVTTVTTESGQYICAPATPEPGSDMSQDTELADRLMELTKKLIVEKTREHGKPIEDLKLY